MVKNISQKVIVKIGDIKPKRKSKKKSKETKKKVDTQLSRNQPRFGGYFPFGVIQTGPGKSETIIKEQADSQLNKLRLLEGPRLDSQNLITFNKPQMSNAINFYDEIASRARAMYEIEKLKRSRSKPDIQEVDDEQQTINYNQYKEPSETTLDDVNDKMTETGYEPDIAPSSEFLTSSSSVLASDIKDSVSLPPQDTKTIDLEAIISAGLEKSKDKKSLDLTEETKTEAGPSKTYVSAANNYDNFKKNILHNVIDKDLTNDALNKMFSVKGNINKSFKIWFTKTYEQYNSIKTPVNIESTLPSEELIRRMNKIIKKVGYDKFISDLSFWNGIKPK